MNKIIVGKESASHMGAVPVLGPVISAQHQCPDTGKSSCAPCLSWLSLTPRAVSTLCCLPRLNSVYSPSPLVLSSGFTVSLLPCAYSRSAHYTMLQPPLLWLLCLHLSSHSTLQSCFVYKVSVCVLIMLLYQLPPAPCHLRVLVSKSIGCPWARPPWPF